MKGLNNKKSGKVRILKMNTVYMNSRNPGKILNN